MVGIYKITNKINNKCYIGYSNNIEKRWCSHRANPKNLELKQDMEKFGLHNFLFEVLEECSVNELPQKETYWIKYYDSYHTGYNMNSGGSGTGNPLNLDYEAIY